MIAALSNAYECNFCQPNVQKKERERERGSRSKWKINKGIEKWEKRENLNAKGKENISRRIKSEESRKLAKIEREREQKRNLGNLKERVRHADK